MPVLASVLVCVMKFVNSFARRQHLFHIAAKPSDVDWNIMSYLALSFSFEFRPKYSHYFNLFAVVITFREFHGNAFSILAK